MDKKQKGIVMGKLHEFPSSAQAQIQRYLDAGNFIAAKELYDYFLAKKNDHDKKMHNNPG